jgi:hypothetical protein
VIDQTDGRLRDWVEEVDPDADVSLEPPSGDRPGRGVGLYLLGIGERPPPRGADRPPLQLWLRYLVTTWAEQPEEAHRLLLDLVFAAMEGSDMEVDLRDEPPDLWAALGAAPQPSFVLRLPVRRERPVAPAPPVLWPLRIEGASPITLEGFVIGPREIPIVGASVGIPAIQQETTTDRRGRFRFPRVPGPPVRTELVIRAKGRSVSVTAKPEPGKPIVIPFDPLEDRHAGIPDA